MKSLNYYQFNFITNFNPHLSEDVDLKYLDKLNKSTKIVCKNLIIFILCVREIISQKEFNLFDWKFKIFILPLKKTLYTLLRAPYRYKLAKNQLMFKRYNLVISAKQLKQAPVIKNIGQIHTLLDNFIDKSKKFETNIAYQRRGRIVFSIKYPEYFKYNI